MPTEGQMRKTAIVRYKYVVAFMAVLGAMLLLFGIIAVTKYPKGGFGPPYYVGSLVAGPFVLGYALLCRLVVVRLTVEDPDDRIQKQNLECAMRGQQILGIILPIFCFMGIVMAGIGGFNKGYSFSPVKISAGAQALAICILLCCIVVLLVDIYSLCTLCTYASVFGVVLNQRRHALVIITDNHNRPTTYYAPAGVIASPTPVTSNAAQVQQLEEQNRLLQQQIQLQQQLLNQQQQMGGVAAQQYGMPQQPYGMPQGQFGMPQGQYGVSDGQNGKPEPSAPQNIEEPPPSYDQVAKTE